MLATLATLVLPLAAASAVPAGGAMEPRDTTVTMCEVTYFSDPNCGTQITGVRDTLPESQAANFKPGDYGCNPAFGVSVPATVYAKVTESLYNSAAEAYITRDQVCPPSGPDAVLAVITDNGECVQLAAVTGNEGLSCFGAGGGTLDGNAAGMLHGTTANATAPLIKRTPTCTGFAASSSQSTYTASKRVSSTVSCIGSGQPCLISESDQTETSVETSYSVSVGEEVPEIGFSVTDTFGKSYTDSESTTIQEGLYVPQNQEGFLSTYAPAMEFTGAFTGCSDGSEPSGTAVVISGSLIYQLVITGQ